MKNLWEVVHKLVDGEPLSDAEKRMAHELVDTHLAQHLGIAAQAAEAHEKAAAAHGHLFGKAGP